MKLIAILQPEPEGGYSVIVPSLPGVVTEGDSLDEALANAREAALLSIEIRIDEGIPGPFESPAVIAHEIERCLQDRTEQGLPLTIETHEIEVDFEILARRLL